MIRRWHLPWLLVAVALLLAATTGLPPAQAVPRATTLTVNDNGYGNDANPGDGFCATDEGLCTLEAAVDEANADDEPTTIRFSQRFQDAGRIVVHTLNLVEDQTVIDASEWWDDGEDMPGVEVSGGTLWIMSITGSQCEVYGLYFTGSTTGVNLGGGYNLIGGAGEGESNWFVGGGGVESLGGTGYNTISHNYFRSHNLGPPLGAEGDAPDRDVDEPEGWEGNGWIWLESDYNTISYNLIQDNGLSIGIHIRGDHNTIDHNTIGTKSDGSEDRPMDRGIVLKNASFNTIGPDNRVCGNVAQGLDISGGQDNTVLENSFGAWGHCNSGNGAEGIKIEYADNTQLLRNSIRKNGSHGLWVADGDVTVYGNDISGNGGDGIYLQDGGSTIGGPGGQEQNIISGNAAHGVHLDGASAVVVSGNCIGLDSSCAYDDGNAGHGVLLENGSGSNTIGGDEAGEGNRIGWNDGDAVRLTGTGTMLNFVQGNIIGSAVAWYFPAPNGGGIGIQEAAYGNFIGGLGESMGNTILASKQSGLTIVASSDNVVLGNKIGTDGAGHNWGNDYYGVLIVAAGTTLSKNEIAYNGVHNGESGVLIMGTSATGNALIGNSIHDHQGKGIELTYGGNALVAPPTIQQGSCQGPVSGTACPGCQVEIFSDTDDEGKILEANLTADATSGAFTWNGQPSGPNLTATNRDQDDNTSEFSAPFVIGVCNTPPKAAFTIDPPSGPAGLTYKFDASSSSDEQDPTSALEVRWDWEADGVYDVGWTTKKTASRVFDTVAIHAIRLQVRDTGGLTDATTKNLNIERYVRRVYLPTVVRRRP